MHGCACARHMHRKHVLCASLHNLLPRNPSAAVRYGVMVQWRVAKEWGTRCGCAWLFSSWLSFFPLCEDLRMASLLWDSCRLLTLYSSPCVPSVSLSCPPVGHERAIFLSLLHILAFLSGSEVHIQPQSSDPERVCCISDNIREQIRQSYGGAGRAGVRESVGSHIHGGRAGRGSEGEAHEEKKTVQHVCFYMVELLLLKSVNRAPEILWSLLAVSHLPSLPLSFTLSIFFPLTRTRNTLNNLSNKLLSCVIGEWDELSSWGECKAYLWPLCVSACHLPHIISIGSLQKRWALSFPLPLPWHWRKHWPEKSLFQIERRKQATDGRKPIVL